MTIRDVVAELVHHPFRSVVLRWHWKSATLSVMVRGGLFFATNIASGIHAATQAAVVETVPLPHRWSGCSQRGCRHFDSQNRHGPPR